MKIIHIKYQAVSNFLDILIANIGTSKGLEQHKKTKTSGVFLESAKAIDLESHT